MAKYRVQGPDGAIHLFEGPDDATPAQVEAFAAQTFGAPSNGIPGARKSVVDQIPGVNPNMAQPAPEKPLTLREKVMGAIETPFAIGANLLTAPITYLSGAAGPDVQRAVAKKITYQPRTRVAQQALETVGQAAEAS